MMKQVVSPTAPHILSPPQPARVFANSAFLYQNTSKEEENSSIEKTTLVSIHPYITIIGVFSTLTTFGFCIGLVLFPIFNDYKGSLTYISNGMESHCGWSGTVLGSCGVFIAICEIIAAMHTMNSYLTTAVLVQASAWCMIMGVSDTGWSFHYVALVIFLSATMYFHHNLCLLHPFDTFVYQKVNTITALNVAFFFLAFLIHLVVTSEKDRWIAIDIAVSLELTLLCCMTAQNLCVIWALNQYKSIHLLFERQQQCYYY